MVTSFRSLPDLQEGMSRRRSMRAARHGRFPSGRLDVVADRGMPESYTCAAARRKPRLLAESALYCARRLATRARRNLLEAATDSVIKSCSLRCAPAPRFLH